MKNSSNFTRYFFAFLVLMVFCVLVSDLDVNAAEAGGISFNLSADDVPAGYGSYSEGISSVKSGYMIYIVDQNGNAISPDAKLVTSTGTNYFRPIGSESTVWNVTSRLGGYTCRRVNYLGADWGAPITSGAGWVSNEPSIRSWMADYTLDPLGDKPNAYMLIKQYWGTSYADGWVNNNYNLILEPVYTFRAWYKYDMVGSYAGRTSSVTNESKHNAPYLVGTTKGLAEMMSSFLSSLSSRNRTQVTSGFPLGDRSVTYTFYTSFHSSPMVSGYARGFYHCEKLSSPIGSLSAGISGSGYLNLSQIRSTGGGILAVTASSMDIDVDESEDTPTPPPSPDTYDGTLYTLTSAGGSSSSGGGIGSFSGGGSGDTTYLGSGYGADRCAIGDLYAENCATGDEPYALADRLKSGMSYEGSVPPVVFSGTSYDLAVDNSMAILPSMLTVDPSTFPHVDISSSPDSSYTSYLSTIRGSLSPSISLNYRGSSVDTYSGGSLESTPVIGGVADTKTYRIKRVCTLNQANCSSSGSAISWGVSGDYNNLSLKFAQVFYNHAYCAASSGSSLLENTDLMRAFWVSSDTYVAGLKADGTLQAYWEARLEEKRVSVGSSSGNSARSAWEAENPAPIEPAEEDYVEEGDYEEALEEYEDALTAWQEASDAEFDSAYTVGYNSVDASTFTCPYETPNSWVFKYYYCSPIMQRLYGVHDKLPIDDGPARGRELWDEAWKVSFSLSVQNTAPISSDVLDRMIVYMPLAGNVCTDVGGVSSVGYYVSNEHVTNTDFLLPDATSMDMR